MARAAQEGWKDDREFPFTPEDFEAVRQLVGEHTGIALSDIKSDMVYSRLTRRLRATGCKTFSEYLERLRSNEAEELDHFVNALTTNLTAFFREEHHFDHLAEVALPEMMALAKDRRLRLWSAGCSTGEEAYSMAMVVRETVPEGWDIRILATDLDTEVLRQAERGVYDAGRVRGMPQTRLRRHFLRGRGANEGKVRVRDEVRRLVKFQRLNLIDRPWPMRERFHGVFCRNVIIYFNKQTQRELFDYLTGYVCPPGWLYIGHSETLWQVTERFEPHGRTVYRLVE